MKGRRGKFNPRDAYLMRVRRLIKEVHSNLAGRKDELEAISRRIWGFFFYVVRK